MLIVTMEIGKETSERSEIEIDFHDGIKSK